MKIGRYYVSIANSSFVYRTQRGQMIPQQMKVRPCCDQWQILDHVIIFHRLCTPFLAHQIPTGGRSPLEFILRISQIAVGNCLDKGVKSPNVPSLLGIIFLEIPFWMMVKFSSYTMTLGVMTDAVQLVTKKYLPETSDPKKNFNQSERGMEETAGIKKTQRVHQNKLPRGCCSPSASHCNTPGLGPRGVGGEKTEAKFLGGSKKKRETYGTLKNTKCYKGDLRMLIHNPWTFPEKTNRGFYIGRVSSPGRWAYLTVQ